MSEVKCSTNLFDQVEKSGGILLCGRQVIPLLNKMRETGCSLGGEMSGHVFFGERFFGYDDAIYATLKASGDHGE